MGTGDRIAIDSSVFAPNFFTGMDHFLYGSGTMLGVKKLYALQKWQARFKVA